MTQSIDDILQSITSSLKATDDSITSLHDRIQTPNLPGLVTELLQKTNQSLPEGVSLLDLKNSAMLSYLNNLILIILARVESLKTNDTKSLNELKDKAVNGSIVQRVVLERGVKGLEKKLSYQLDKMVRNYNKIENDSSEQVITKKLKEDASDSDSEEDSEDELNYKPDTSSLVQTLKTDPTSKESVEGEKGEKYKPPKISAALPPSEFRETNNKTSRNGTKLQAMEEYLIESGDAPMVEQSIGSNILNNGRGGVQTLRDRKKEEEIKRYEESNFTRLSTNMSKKDKSNKRKQDANKFFGEDWGIFNNTRTDMNTSRKTKSKSAWDRAKKRRTE